MKNEVVFEVVLANKTLKMVKFNRSLDMVVTRPGNTEQQAFANGYQNIKKGRTKNQYGHQRPSYFKAGQQAAKST